MKIEARPANKLSTLICRAFEIAIIETVERPLPIARPEMVIFSSLFVGRKKLRAFIYLR